VSALSKRQRNKGGRYGWYPKEADTSTVGSTGSDNGSTEIDLAVGKGGQQMRQAGVGWEEWISCVGVRVGVGFE
jgi:hypothetical protein